MATKYCRKEDPQPPDHKSRCLSGWHRQSIDRCRRSPDELSTIHKKPETVSCLKIYSIVILLS